MVIKINFAHHSLLNIQGNLFLSMNRPETAVFAFRGAQELRPDLRSYQGQLTTLGRKMEKVVIRLRHTNFD